MQIALFFLSLRAIRFRCRLCPHSLCMGKAVELRLVLDDDVIILNTCIILIPVYNNNFFPVSIFSMLTISLILMLMFKIPTRGRATSGGCSSSCCRHVSGLLVPSCSYYGSLRLGFFTGATSYLLLCCLAPFWIWCDILVTYTLLLSSFLDLVRGRPICCLVLTLSSLGFVVVL